MRASRSCRIFDGLHPAQRCLLRRTPDQGTSFHRRSRRVLGEHHGSPCPHISPSCRVVIREHAGSRSSTSIRTADAFTRSTQPADLLRQPSARGRRSPRPPADHRARRRPASHPPDASSPKNCPIVRAVSPFGIRQHDAELGGLFAVDAGTDGHLVRLTPRDFPIFEAWIMAPDYPQARKLAEKCSRGSVAKGLTGVSQEFIGLSRSPQRNGAALRPRKVSEQVVEARSRKAFAHADRSHGQGYLFPYPLRQSAVAHRLRARSGSSAVLPGWFCVRRLR